MADLELKGADELLRNLSKIEDLPRFLAPATREVLDLLLRRMKEYPPPRGTYRRTFKLRDSWQAIPEASGDTLGRVKSFSQVAPYNRYVQSAENQAWMHQGRWQTDEQVAREKEREAAKILSDFLTRELAKL
jgi:hypothetical protein